MCEYDILAHIICVKNDFVAHIITQNEFALRERSLVEIRKEAENQKIFFRAEKIAAKQLLLAFLAENGLIWLIISSKVVEIHT